MANEFTARAAIKAPGTTVFGYRRGDAVSAQVVEAWELTVGDANDPEADVVEGDLPEGVPDEPQMGRPGEADNRAAWEAWGRAHGMSESEAIESSLEDLYAIQDEAAVTTTTRPADSAKKSEWQAYATKLGADETWAYADSTTKADLQNYHPGDTIALAATEASQA